MLSIVDFLAFPHTKKSWSEEEKVILKNTFAKYLYGTGLPGKNECEEVLLNNPTKFKGRNWRNVKDCVRNIKDKLQKDNQKLFD